MPQNLGCGSKNSMPSSAFSLSTLFWYTTRHYASAPVFLFLKRIDGCISTVVANIS